MNNIIDFILESKYEDFNEEVINESKKCLLDTLSVLTIGSQTKLSKITNDFAKKFYQGEDSTSFIHKTKMSQLGSLFVSAMSIDAFDMHDGHVLTKGHMGVSIIPAALIINNGSKISGKDVLTNIIIGYEISTRAGIALHGSVNDYHTSGAWNALGVCAIACRNLNLTRGQTLHALGICEFYAPRSQMMKIIDHPTMLKDGSGFGAFVGLKAALLAKAGFTGAPSLLLYSKETANYWEDLGEKFEILRQYFKPYPICRWAQSSIEAVNFILKNYTFDINDIKHVQIQTFHEATRLNNEIPSNTEEAQYALKYPTVLFLAQKDLVGIIIKEEFSLDSQTLSLFNKTSVSEKQEFNDAFPEKRYANVTIELNNGDILESGTKEAIWGENDTPSYEDIKDKFYLLNKEIFDNNTLNNIESTISNLENSDDISKLTNLL